MDGFTYILLSIWFAWCQVFISGKLIHVCYIHWCSIVEVVVDMLRVPSLASFPGPAQLSVASSSRAGRAWEQGYAKSVAVTWLCAHCFDKHMRKFWTLACFSH